MEWITKFGWASLAALHIMPSAVLFAPSLAARLYGVDPDGELGALIVHRAAMFFTVVVVAVIALFDPSARRLAAIVAAISMISFLILYVRAGMPAGSLRSIAVADLAGLVPLAWVSLMAWRS